MEMKIDTATVVCSLHEHYDPGHLEHVVSEMARRGPPRIRASFDPVTGTWFAAEGTHRLRAAKQLGMAPVMVPVPWRRGRKALEAARHAAVRRGHMFPAVSVASEER